MTLIRGTGDSTAWAVGRFDVLRSSAPLPNAMVDRIPPISLFSISGRVDGRVSGVVRAEARDEAAANNLRDTVRGFIGLARLQTNADPRIQTVLQSVELTGTGKAVALSFSVPGEVLDDLKLPPQRREPRAAH
jgi:hypothetical protein